MHLKGVLNWIKIKWIFRGFCCYICTWKFSYGRWSKVSFFFKKPLHNFFWKFGNSILMPLTLCTQTGIFNRIKIKLFFFFFLHLDLEIFIAEREHFTLYSFIKFCESHPNASVYMYPNGSFGWMKIKCIFGGFCCYSWT